MFWRKEEGGNSVVGQVSLIVSERGMLQFQDAVYTKDQLFRFAFPPLAHVILMVSDEHNR